ncbi:expressed unknown protein [Seminavis robusta]|uniref:DUF6824 domain-containing protein n=1 Tax=Seminavis robusta TaxID=568900 RepID=A0A9N8ETR3_9STRA|nr:expressed unknown protein [Seminavis robusta]|eukprot:Sro1663_g289440.1 n/a (404) ;mRNA; r:10086-11297
MNRFHNGMSFPTMGMNGGRSMNMGMGMEMGMEMMGQQDHYYHQHQHQHHQQQQQQQQPPHMPSMNISNMYGNEQLSYQMMPWMNSPSACSSSSTNVNHHHHVMSSGASIVSHGSMGQHQLPVAQSICTKDGEPRIPFPSNFVPTINHVICGRGKKSYGHIGNKHFLKLVALHMDAYAEATNKQEKSDIVQAVVDEMEARGGFIRLDPQTGCYYQAEEGAGREKTSQALRDGLNHKYKSSKDIKRKNRKQKRLARQAIHKKQTQGEDDADKNTPSSVSDDGSDSESTTASASDDSPCTTKSPTSIKELVVTIPAPDKTISTPPRTVSATSVNLALDAAAVAAGTVSPSTVTGSSDSNWDTLNEDGVIHLVDGDSTELEPLPLTDEEVQELPDGIMMGPFDDFGM